MRISRTIFSALSFTILLGTLEVAASAPVRLHKPRTVNPISNLDPVLVGAVYVIRDGRPLLLLDLKGRLSLGQDPGWVVARAYPRPGSYWVGLGQMPERRCRGASVKHCKILRHSLSGVVKWARVSIEAFVDPGKELEVLNRPFTGAAYNSVAEQRIASWRAEIAEAISRSVVNRGDVVAVCIGRAMVDSPVLNVKGSQQQEAAVRVAVNRVSINSGIAFDSGDAHPMTGRGLLLSFPRTTPIMVSATFQPIRLVSGAVQPMVDFTLGAPLELRNTILR